jgi:uncharacterized protein (DUF427 family)
VSLTIGSGPFSTDSRGVLSTGEVPRGAAYAEPYPRRVRALLGGQALVDTDKAWMVHRPGFGAELWFPRDEVSAPGLASTALTEFERADDPMSRALAGLVKLDFKTADRWFVEDEPVYAEVRDPYHRVEVLSSHRHVTVELDGRLLADTHRPKLLFETGLPVHHYLPWSDVRLDLLELSDTISECPYKGDRQHWNLVEDGTVVVPDVAWSLPHPLAEGVPAAEHVCFYSDKVVITVDGVRT